MSAAFTAELDEASGRTERGMSAAFDFYEILIISPVRPELVEGYELI